MSSWSPTQQSERLTDRIHTRSQNLPQTLSPPALLLTLAGSTHSSAGEENVALSLSLSLRNPQLLRILHQKQQIIFHHFSTFAKLMVNLFVPEYALFAEFAS